MALRVGVDVGGTFTDLVAFDEGSGRLMNFKVPTTPLNPEKGIVNSLRDLFAHYEPKEVSYISHATTVATNILLGQKGLELPKVALITTKGFRDIIEVGRQKRPELYNLFFERPKTLIPRRLRFEVEERIGPRGEVWEGLEPSSVLRVVKRVKALPVEAVAIAFLNSYANPDHELRVKEELKKGCPDLWVSASSEVAPEYREYERTSTVVVNSVLMPKISRYLERLSTRLKGRGVKAPVRIMQSSGGLASVDVVRFKPVSIVESGPAAGCVATSFLSKSLGLGKVISFDMGGTTAKAGITIDGEPELTTEYEVGGRVHTGRVVKGSGYPIRHTFIDLSECSAGGGTIAWVDRGGALKVGPISAGAEPGPAAYGRGGKDPVVTDANLLLGRLNQHELAGGVRVYPELARKAVEDLADEAGLNYEDAVIGIIKIVNSLMANILRIVTVERGHDPREFTIMAFGGAGPMHICPLADELGIRKVLIPPNPGLFSAFGLLVADYVHTFVRGVVKNAGGVGKEFVEGILDEMVREARAVLSEEGRAEGSMAFHHWAEMRYEGQAYELSIPLSPQDWPEGTKKAFHGKHRSVYGYSSEEEGVELVSIRLTAWGFTEKPKIKPSSSDPKEDPSVALAGKRLVYFEETGGSETPIYAREKLGFGNNVPGPAIIEQYDSTTVLYPKWEAEVDGYGNLLLTKGG